MLSVNESQLCLLWEWHQRDHSRVEAAFQVHRGLDPGSSFLASQVSNLVLFWLYDKSSLPN